MSPSCSVLFFIFLSALQYHPAPVPVGDATSLSVLFHGGCHLTYCPRGMLQACTFCLFLFFFSVSLPFLLGCGRRLALSAWLWMLLGPFCMAVDITRPFCTAVDVARAFLVGCGHCSAPSGYTVECLAPPLATPHSSLHPPALPHFLLLPDFSRDHRLFGPSRVVLCWCVGSLTLRGVLSGMAGTIPYWDSRGTFWQFLNHKTPVTLDSNTVHVELIVSDDLTSVRLTDEEQGSSTLPSSLFLPIPRHP
ncbi:uncharacterized protein LOC132849912 [Tachysurus vachellii]|uniref:uncharacterized protein LOC132849912 n=1 Tax=Tachysurus vachellii TaxID=175792 RepID=UPI00296AD81A|nr:uncharacterized protein LOC132849912 [Tachysurus vachellii]